MSKQNAGYEEVNGAVGLGLQKSTLHLTPGIFTDSTTTGKYTWEDALPAGCFYVGCTAVISSAFDDDTSAALTVGKSDTEDEFTDGTNISLATAGTVGEEGEAPLEFIATETDVYLVVTTATDFTLVAAGDGDAYLNLFYLKTRE